MAKKKSKRSSNTTSSPAEAPAERNRWEAENAADTLLRAEQIKADARLFRRAQTILREKQRAISRIEKVRRASGR
jgi:hypothetical protein